MYRHETYDGKGDLVELVERPYTQEELDDQKTKARQQALYAEWKEPFDLLDDILANGIADVKTRRDAIKAAHPKPENL